LWPIEFLATTPIEPGKLADLMVLSRSPLTADPSSLIQIAVERTMVGGK